MNKSLFFTLTVILTSLGISAQKKVLNLDSLKKMAKLNAMNKGSIAPPLKGKLYQDNINNYSVNFEGKISVLDFWFMNCLPCQKSIPYMDSLKDKYEKEGVQFFAVNYDDNNDKALQKFPEFIKEQYLNSNIILINIDIEANFHVTSFPTFFVIDQEGKVCYCITGFYPYVFKEIASTIDKLMNK